MNQNVHPNLSGTTVRTRERSTVEKVEEKAYPFYPLADLVVSTGMST